jgi:steroid 5-alpha reductase family enzyme
MSVLVTCWGARLTYNFARKGGYNWGDEDYRWGPLRKYMGFFFFQLFNLGFIAIYQNILLFLISAPATFVPCLICTKEQLCDDYDL